MTLAKPTPAQLTWQDCELGLVYHYDLDVYMPGGHHHERSRREVLDASLYNPTELDTDQWLQCAADMGAGYAILTATHHQGFLQWQSDLYPFGVKQSPWRDGKGDLVADFAASCRKFGIKPGVYIGIRFNAWWNVYGYLINGGEGGDQERQAEYLRICEKTVEELCSRYGDWCEVWFDGGVITPEQGGPDVLPIVRRLQPNAVYYHSQECAEHRWAGTESGTTDYPCWATLPSISWQYQAHKKSGKEWTDFLKHGVPDGESWCPAMCDAPIRDHDWLWKPNREDVLFPAEDLMDMYVKSVGRNANLIIGAVPDRRGLIPDADAARYAEFGQLIRQRFGTALAKTQGIGNELVLELPHPSQICDIVIQEDIAQGERIREFTVSVRTSQQNEWHPIESGSCIGHKLILPVDVPDCSAVKLTITTAATEPHIRSLAAYGSA